MKSKRIFLLVAAVIHATVFAGHVPTARAALCGKCRDMMFTESEGRCIECGSPTSSGALKLCPKCSTKRHQCEHCLAKLAKEDEAVPAAPLPDPAGYPLAAGGDADQRRERPAPAAPGGTEAGPPSNGSTAPLWTNAQAAPNVSPPAAGTDRPADPLPTYSVGAPHSAGPDSTAPPPPAQLRLKPIDPARAGSYTAGNWRFQLHINGPGTRSEGRWGRLAYAGQMLPRGNINDYYMTPWGPMYWVGDEKRAWGLHGFMPVPAPQNQHRGRQLALPASLAAACAG